jgi:hypothetical protein
MTPAVGYRVSPWIIVALIATAVLLAVVAVALAQSGMLHATGAHFLADRPQIICGSSPGGCP